jgi:DNA mismatch repair protein MSH2
MKRSFGDTKTAAAGVDEDGEESNVGATLVAQAPEVDSKQQHSFLTFYKGLAQVEGLIRFFDRKGYYSVHGHEAMYVAQELFRTSSCIKQWECGSSETVPCVWVSSSNFECFARELLLQRGHRVEVWASSGSSWSVSLKGSPGFLDELEDIVFKGNSHMDDSAVLSVLRVRSTDSGVQIGMSAVDTTNFRITFAQFTDNESLTMAEAALIRAGAKECIVSADSLASPIGKRIHDLLMRCGVTVNNQKKNIFSSKDFDSVLKRLLPSSACSTLMNLIEQDLAYEAVAAAVRYCELSSDTTNEGRFSMAHIDLQQFMLLDSAAIRALSLLPLPGENKSGSSICSLLDVCKTTMGSRLLRVWLKQPLLDMSAITARHDVVQSLVSDASVRGSLRETFLKGCPDLGRIARKFLRVGRASLQDAFRLYQFADHLQPLISLMTSIDCDAGDQIQSKFIVPLQLIDSELGNYRLMIENTIDLDMAKQNEFVINSSFDEGLQDINNRQKKAEKQLTRIASEVADDLNLSSDKVHLEENSVHGHFLRMVRKDEVLLRDRSEYTCATQLPPLFPSSH